MAQRVCSTHVCMGNNLSFPYAGVSNYHPQLSAAASFLGEPSASRQERESAVTHVPRGRS